MSISRLHHIRFMHSSTSYPQSHLSLIMEIELHPAFSLLLETFNVLVTPVEMLVDSLNSHLDLQRYKILFICGNYSHILSRPDGTSPGCSLPGPTTLHARARRHGRLNDDDLRYGHIRRWPGFKLNLSLSFCPSLPGVEGAQTVPRVSPRAYPLQSS